MRAQPKQRPPTNRGGRPPARPPTNRGGRPPARPRHSFSLDRLHPLMVEEMTWTRDQIEQARVDGATIVVPHAWTNDV